MYRRPVGGGGVVESVNVTPGCDDGDLVGGVILQDRVIRSNEISTRPRAAAPPRTGRSRSRGR